MTTICLVAGTEDLVIVVDEECRHCTDSKLSVISRIGTLIDNVEVAEFLQSTFVSRRTVENYWGRVNEDLWKQPRRVRVRCECGRGKPRRN